MFSHLAHYSVKMEDLKVLDVGCGKGNLLLSLENLGVKDLYGIDIQHFPFHLFKNEKTATESFKKIRHAQLDIDTDLFPHDTNCFDVVFLTGVLEHLHNPANAFSEIKRVIKNNGFLCIITPNSANLKNRISLIFGKSIYHGLEGWFSLHRIVVDESPPKFIGHIREYTKEEINRILEMYNFIPTSWSYNITERASQYPKILLRIYNLFERIYPPLSYSINIIAHKK